MKDDSLAMSFHMTLSFSAKLGDPSRMVLCTFSICFLVTQDDGLDDWGDVNFDVVDVAFGGAVADAMVQIAANSPSGSSISSKSWGPDIQVRFDFAYQEQVHDATDFADVDLDGYDRALAAAEASGSNGSNNPPRSSLTVRL